MKVQVAFAALALGAAINANAATVEFTNSLVVVLADGAADTSFSAANGNLPDGDRVTIDQYTSDYGRSGVAHGLLGFADFSLPTGAAVNSATLSVFTKSSSDGPVSFYQLGQAWDATSTWNTFGGDGVTPGVEALAAPVAMTTSYINDETPITIDVTAIVANWAAGAPAYGFGIINSSTDGWDLQVVTDGSEFSPKLTVDYAPVPLPAAATLLLPALLGLSVFRRRRA